jgi:hypothetical protein
LIIFYLLAGSGAKGRAAAFARAYPQKPPGPLKGRVGHGWANAAQSITIISSNPSPGWVNAAQSSKNLDHFLDLAFLLKMPLKTRFFSLKTKTPNPQLEG